MKHITLLAVLLCGCSDAPQPGDVWMNRSIDPFDSHHSPTNYVLSVQGNYVQYKWYYFPSACWLTSSIPEDIFVISTRKAPAPTPQQERDALRAEEETK